MNKLDEVPPTPSLKPSDLEKGLEVRIVQTARPPRETTKLQPEVSQWGWVVGVGRRLNRIERWADVGVELQSCRGKVVDGGMRGSERGIVLRL